MSSLIFEVTDNSVAVAADTMCVDELGSFRGHVSKAFAIPPPTSRYRWNRRAGRHRALFHRDQQRQRPES